MTSFDETRPPLGVMPRKFWIEHRIVDLAEAIVRYQRHGNKERKHNLKLMREWSDELSQLITQQEIEQGNYSNLFATDSEEGQQS